VDSANSSSSRNLRGRMLLAAPAVRAGAGAEGLQGSGPTYNYVLAANQESLVGHLQRLGAVAGPTGCLVYLEQNVTLSKPPVPAAGIPMARPMAIVGLSRWVTSIDWYMQVWHFDWFRGACGPLVLHGLHRAYPVGVAAVRQACALCHVGSYGRRKAHVTAAGTGRSSQQHRGTPPM
jgi:hypothetical protein